jgi:D-alanyl-D-alanine carboxypeptidase
MRALEKRVNLLSNELASSTSFYTKNISTIRDEQSGLTSTLTTAKNTIDAVTSQVLGVQDAVGSITGKVNTLQKLTNIDKEILQKYSKVYFLSENYVPAHITLIPSRFVYSTTREEKFSAEAWPFLSRLLSDAEQAGVQIYVKSGYRSFGEQKSLKSAYSVMYGAGTANMFSADQGYSEHQLGTTIDFITSGLGGNLTGFDTTHTYEWLTQNAYRYGFILSYPKNNGYYIYEPWHWRFVGIKLATYLHDNNKNFYDMDQRDIDVYLANTFDW